MTQSVELLLDADSESLVLADWRLLDEAGLESQVHHPGASNRPHLTLAAVASVDPDAEEAVAQICRELLPVSAYVGPLVVFGRDPVVLVRLVVATPELLALHRAVAGVVGTPDDALTAPGRWVPHVTLAHRMPADQLQRALEVLPRANGGPARLERARRWDGDGRRDWVLA